MKDKQGLGLQILGDTRYGTESIGYVRVLSYRLFILDNDLISIFNF